MWSAIASANRSSTWGSGSEAPRPRGSNQTWQLNDEPVEEAHEAGFVPHLVNGEHRRMRHQHVDRAVADDLVGDPPPGVSANLVSGTAATVRQSAEPRIVMLVRSTSNAFLSGRVGPPNNATYPAVWDSRYSSLVAFGGGAEAFERRSDR